MLFLLLFSPSLFPTRTSSSMNLSYVERIHVPVLLQILHFSTTSRITTKFLVWNTYYFTIWPLTFSFHFLSLFFSYLNSQPLQSAYKSLNTSCLLMPQCLCTQVSPSTFSAWGVPLDQLKGHLSHEVFPDNGFSSTHLVPLSALSPHSSPLDCVFLKNRDCILLITESSHLA